MSDIVRKVLQKNYLDITRDLELTAEFRGNLLHYGLFNEDMLEEIMVEKTRKAQIQLMLKKLPRRGPRAFEMFVRSLQDDYPWLADKLRKTQHTLHNQHRDAEEMSLRSRVDIFVHEKFGNSKRFSEEDKKGVRTFLYTQLLRQQSIDEDQPDGLDVHITAEDTDNINSCPDMSKDLPVHEENQAVLVRVYRLLSQTNEADGCSECTKTISIEMIEEQAQQITNKLNQLQNELNACYTLFGIDNPQPDQHLSDTVKEATEEITRLRRLKDDLNRIERQRDKLEIMLEETKEELRKKMYRLSQLAHENERSQAQLKDMREKCEQLESIQRQHLEKQDTLFTLKKIVRDLSPMCKSMPHHLMSESMGDIERGHKSKKSKSQKLPKIKTTYHSPQCSKPITHHHYTDPTVASREHAVIPNRLIRGSSTMPLQNIRKT